MSPDQNTAPIELADLAAALVAEGQGTGRRSSAAAALMAMWVGLWEWLAWRQ